MCGIFGGSARVGHELNVFKLITLGIYNSDRGTDSCGYYWAGYMDRGVNTDSDIKDYLANNKFKKGKLPGEVFMGHTRKSTTGTNSFANAHPHQIDDYVQTHNGTIDNIKELTKTHKVGKDYVVDSKGLAAIINKDGLDVLAEYIGGAALAFTWMNDPYALYIYHGASKEKKGGTLWEERPLYVLDQPEGLYYSSIENSLNAISENDERARELDHNIVYRVVAGEFDSTYEWVVDRSEMNIKEEKAIVVHKGGDKGNNLDANLGDVIRLEEIPSQAYQRDRVYYYQGRYWSNHTLLEGSYQIDREGFIVENPHQLSRQGIEVYYFIKGAMMRDLKAYEHAILQSPMDDELNVAMMLSTFSKYPLFCINTEAHNVTPAWRNKWYQNTRQLNHKHSFNPLFSAKYYHIEDGRTVEISHESKPKAYAQGASK